MKWIMIALTLPGICSCLVSPLPDEEVARVRLALELPGAPRVAASAEPMYWDSQGRLHLQDFPKFVRVSVLHGDREIGAATWPDPRRGIGDGEGPDGEVTLELSVPAGAGRIVSATGFFVDLQQVLVYQPEEVEPVELVAGQLTHLPLRMVRAPTGTLEATVRCELGNQGPSRPVRIALVDVEAQVIYPAQDLVETQLHALVATLRSIPVGRPMLARVEILKATTGSSVYLELRRTFIVEVPNETKPLQLTVPCAF